MEHGTTPKAVLESLTRLFPAFAAQCCPESLFANEDGTFTFCGLFCELTDFVRDQFPTMPEIKRREMFRFVEECITNQEYDELDISVCTCFLENMANGELSSELRRYMGPQALTFFDTWSEQVAYGSEAGRLDNLVWQAHQDFEAGRCRLL